MKAAALLLFLGMVIFLHSLVYSNDPSGITPDYRVATTISTVKTYFTKGHSYNTHCKEYILFVIYSVEILKKGWYGDQETIYTVGHGNLTGCDTQLDSLMTVANRRVDSLKLIGDSLLAAGKIQSTIPLK